MRLGTAIAEIMKLEGIEILCGYPVNHLIEFAANADIRPVMLRQERIGIHMAHAISRPSSRHSIAALCIIDPAIEISWLPQSSRNSRWRSATRADARGVAVTGAAYRGDHDGFKPMCAARRTTADLVPAACAG